MNQWKDAFHFTKSERRGIFILTTLLVLLSLAPSFLERFYSPPTSDFTAFKIAIEKFEKEQLLASQANEKAEAVLFRFNPNTCTEEELHQLGISASIAQRILNYRAKGGKFYKKADLKRIYGLAADTYERLSPFIELPSSKPIAKKTKEPRSLKPFPFDPNIVTVEELKKMGLSRKVWQQLINYRKKGGKFRRKEDVKKIYALSQEAFQQLSPFIQIAKVSSKSNKQQPITVATSVQYDAPTKVFVDINRASQKDWERLDGIGPYYAKRIIRFREALGGFSAIGQIGETYKLPDSVFQKIKTHLVLSPITLKLAINVASVAELTAHPYISRKQAQVLVSYRNNHGPFKDWEAVKKVRVFDKTALMKLKPYLNFERALRK